MQNNKKTLVFIHGGEVFANAKEFEQYLLNKEVKLEDYTKKKSSWKEKFFENLSKQKVTIINPHMPCRKNAKYKYWKIWFEKHIPFFNEKTIFVGHSLGASFLVKYFAQNKLSLVFPQLHLISPAVEGVKDFSPPKDISSVQEQFRQIYIYHSEDDFVVPVQDALELKNRLPKAKLKLFKSKGHFILNNSPNLEKTLDFNAR